MAEKQEGPSVKDSESHSGGLGVGWGVLLGPGVPLPPSVPCDRVPLWAPTEGSEGLYWSLSLRRSCSRLNVGTADSRPEEDPQARLDRLIATLEQQGLATAEARADGEYIVLTEAGRKLLEELRAAEEVQERARQLLFGAGVGG